MAGKYLRGALISFMPTFLIPLPNITIFQYNPETMTHTWTPAAGLPAQPEGANPLAVKGVPGEAFSFTLAMDAADMIADGSPVAVGIATVSGIQTRLAALEMLLYPVPDTSSSLVGSVSAAVGSLAGSVSASVKTSIPASVVPTVLFVWGAGRVVPVRVTSLTITEKLYDGLLNPTHAEAQLGLRVLVPEELAKLSGPLATIANGAYTYTQTLREALALANLANAAESTIGMLPF